MAFKKGKSGNPGGRKKMDPDVVALARENSVKALKVIIEIMGNKRCAFSTRMAAANAVLDRAHGRPQTSVELSGKGGAPLVPYLRDDLGAQERAILTARVIGFALKRGQLEMEKQNGATAALIEGVSTELVETEQEKL